MVIQEAFIFGRPVVASDIGGMSEKVNHGIDGLHVPAGNVRAWSDTLLKLSGMTDEWDRLRAGIVAPIGYADCAEHHMKSLPL